ncbi:hypothetical protein TNCV_4984481 [Trichonephila clavipes]|nr:hypothetical protein TNCV_4984481 [Trichonephila clavipes]
MRSRFCEWQQSGARGYGYSDRNSKFSNGNAYVLPSQNVQHMRKPKIALKRHRYVRKPTCYTHTNSSSRRTEE